MPAKDLADLMDFLGDDGFVSPLMPSTAYPEGKSYTIPSPDAETGLRLNALADLTLKQAKGDPISEHDMKRLRLDTKDEREFVAQVLSHDVVEEMTRDGVRWVHMKRLSQYGFMYFGISREAADDAAKNGLLSGKALPQNRATRRASSTGAKSATAQGSAASKPRQPRPKVS